MRWPALLLLLLLARPAWADVSVGSLVCERRVDPLAIDTPAPRLGWALTSDQRRQRQTAYHVLVASTEQILATDRGDLWDSGKVTSGETLAVVYAGRTLPCGQRCHWKVRVWDRDGVPSVWSAAAAWEMGPRTDADWTGQWIGDGEPTPATDAAFYAEDPAPLFRRPFTLPVDAARARLHISGLGYYEASINGRRVGDHVLDPGWTKYDRRVLYSTYDVTDLLRKGDNCIGVTLGNGWYNPLPLRMWGRTNLREHLVIGRPRFIAQLNIELADGNVYTVVSDPSWKVGDGPIRFNNIYLGEVYDARLEERGWDEPEFDDAAWKDASAADAPGPLKAQSQPPIRASDRFAAIRVTEPAPGTFIYDMGQNFSGWASIRVDAPAGTKLVMRYGELLNADGALNPMTGVCGQIKGTYTAEDGAVKHVGGEGSPPIAWQTNTYITRGGGETYTPRFTFQGFRYLEITGLDHAIPLADVVGVRLHSDVPTAGEFSCSNDRFNGIQEICRRTFLANVFSVQSDCPHRERFGYGGDIAATSDAFMLNFDMSTFYAKAVRDFADNALPDGMFTDTAPFVGIQYCGVGWAMAHPLLLTQLYQYYGDKRLIEEQYEAARTWLLLVAKAYPDGIVKDGLGDHEALVDSPAPALVTPLFVRGAHMLAGMAILLDRADDAALFEAIARRSTDAYAKQLIDDATGKVGPGTQASQAIALQADMVPFDTREKALALLLGDIEARNGHLSTGIMGTRCMLEVLSREGHADAAYRIVDQPDFPGWGWMLGNGATTLWEHWTLDTNTFSHSHPMFGSVSQWFINWLGGIQPAPDAVGFDSIAIRPQILADLQWVKSSYASVRGRVTSNWRREGEGAASTITLEVEVPVGATAIVYVPANAAAEVTESDNPLAKAEGVDVLGNDVGSVMCRVGSGTYLFRITKR